MIDAVLKLHLDPIAQRRRRWRLWRAAGACWGGAALAGVVLLLLHRDTGWWSPWVLPALLTATALALLLVWSRSRRWHPDYRAIARRIEHEHPDLHALLLTAVEQEPDPATGRMNALQRRVVHEAVDAGLKHRWVEHVGREHLAWAGAGHLLAFLLFLGVVINLRGPAPRPHTAFAERGVTVSPGDTTVERGSSVVILARFEEFVPTEATLVLAPENEPARRVPLTRNLEDPVFAAALPEVPADTVYHVEYEGDRTREFKISVFDYPALQRADAKLTYPDFTGLKPKLIEDTRRVSAVEGTSLEYTFTLNKPVRSARLVARDQSDVPLTPSESSPNVYQAAFKLEKSQRYELLLVDEAGRSNRAPAELFVNVQKNKAPELKFAFPKGDQRVSSLEELAFQAEAWDDFGLRAYGLAFSTPGQEPQFLEVGRGAGANEKRPFNHLLAMEDLGVQTDQLVSYFLWAEDLGPDGEPRRTFGDMFFAEVRPFEEIFREGQPPPEGGSSQSGMGNQTEKLAELQKQIISATWKIQRRETEPKPSGAYAKDVAVVRDSQQQALEMVGELKTKTDDPRLAGMVELAEQEMQAALKHLTQAVDQNVTKPLPPALNAEQAAYQALLRLQARVYQVSRMRNQRGGGGGGQRAQRQLDQLELKQEEDRYETQRQAQQQQSPEQREQLQVLNRLRELARRQEDINERLKELQAALREARTEEEREALRRQLKRLQEEQQQMLADLDELRQRMAQSENPSQMSEPMNRLDETRSELRRAAEELERDAIPQALAAGTRAERDLEEMRDEFRRRTSSQFSEQMRQMRSEARQLAQREEDLGRELEAMNQTQRRSLSDTAERKELAGQLDRQSDALTNLLGNVRQVTEQSETAEPLLYKQLYDTLRKTDQARVDEKLNLGAELLRRGFTPQATQIEQQSRTNIQDLKRGIERAAESVLGSEADALRQARREVEELARQVEQEMAQARPDLVRPDEPSQRGAAGERRAERTEAQGRSSQQSQSPDQQSPQGAREGRREMAQAGQRGERSQTDAQGREQTPAGRQPGESQQPQAQPQAGQQPGQQSASPQGQQPGGEQPGQAQGERDARGQAAQRPAASAPRDSANGGGRDDDARRSRAWTGLRTWINEGGGPGGPLTGERYTEWSDRLRDVEEMVEMPELRNEAAAIRERAREMRLEFKRHSKEPQWEMVDSQIVQPLKALRNVISEELARRESPDSLVPIDRDPVPGRYSDLVRRYYEKLGTD